MASWWALGLVGGLVLWASGSVRSFENAAARDIASKLEGEHKTVKVRAKIVDPFRASRGDLRAVTISASHFRTDSLPLFTEPERPQTGKVGRLELDLRDVTLRGLRVERLSAKIPDCRYDFALAKREKQVRLSKSGIGTGEVLLLAKDLEAFLVHKFKEIKTATVTLSNDRIRVEGQGQFLVVNTAFEVDAAIVVKDGVRLYLDDAKILFDGEPVDSILSSELIRILNPVLDLDADLGLSGAMQIEAITISSFGLVGRGRAQIPTRP